MKQQPLVSIIIPVYNVEEYIRDCLESVIKQTYTNIEVILINDGSTDKSYDICSEYLLRDNRITLYNQDNKGLSGARNAGLALAKGEYVYFIDSDDYIDLSMVELLVEIAENNDSDFIFFDAFSFTDDKNFKIKQNYIRKDTYEANSGINLLSALYENNDYHASVPLLFIKKSFIILNNLNFMEGIYHEDEIFTFSCFCLANKVSYCDKALYKRRYRKNSITTINKTSKHFNSMISVFFAMHNLANTLNITTISAVNKCICRSAFNVINVFEKLSKEDKNINRNVLDSFKKCLKDNKYLNCKALELRCKSKLLWIVYKIKEKII